MIIEQHRFKHSHRPNNLVFYKESPMRTDYDEMGEKTEAAISTNAIKPVWTHMNKPLLIDVKQTQTAHFITEEYADNEKKNKIIPVKWKLTKISHDTIRFLLKICMYNCTKQIWLHVIFSTHFSPPLSNKATLCERYKIYTGYWITIYCQQHHAPKAIVCSRSSKQKKPTANQVPFLWLILVRKLLWNAVYCKIHTEKSPFPMHTMTCKLPRNSN